MKSTRAVAIVAFVLVASGCGGSNPAASSDPSLWYRDGRQLTCEGGGLGPTWLDGRVLEKRTAHEIAAVRYSLSEQVARCGRGGGPTIYVKFKLEADGTVAFASSQGEYGETEVGDCASRVVCGGRFVPAESPVTIMTSFRLGEDYTASKTEPDGKCLSSSAQAGADGQSDGEWVLNERSVDRVVYMHMEELKCCFAGSLGSKVTEKKSIYVEVGADGSVVRNSPRGCMGQVFAGMRFPPPSGDSPVAFLYELRIKRGEDGKIRVSKESKPFDWRP